MGGKVEFEINQQRAYILKKFRVGIIGCGLIGRKRALSLDEENTLVARCDTDCKISDRFGETFSCEPFTDYKDLLHSTYCDIVIVSVINKFAKDIVVDALRMGRHVLVEKPLGRDATEAREMIAYSRDGILYGNSIYKENSSRDCSDIPLLKVGFNHRFHPAIWKAKVLFHDGAIGQCLSIRARYGHGGRSGMEKEWRASKDLCGGGELLDQGVHVIDLIRWFGGEITEVFGKTETKHWEMNVEDNAVAILKTENDVTASFSVSWTNWKNIFSFEIFGTDGYLRIEGLGGSYGVETLELGRRKKEGGVPDIQLFEFPMEDTSWAMEWKEFLSAIKENRQPIGNGIDGLMANEVIEAIYQSSLLGKVVKIHENRHIL